MMPNSVFYAGMALAREYAKNFENPYCTRFSLCFLNIIQLDFWFVNGPLIEMISIPLSLHGILSFHNSQNWAEEKPCSIQQSNSQQGEIVDWYHP